MCQKKSSPAASHSLQPKFLARRKFLKSSLLAGGATLAALSATRAVGAEFTRDLRRSLVQRGEVILFQGDSITDAGRSREHAATPNRQEGLGSGYAWFAAAQMLVDRPGDGLRIYNRGISGNKVYQLADRWDADCLSLKPTLLSILIGVNDFWHRLDGKYDGTVDVYERDFLALVERSRKALPRLKLVICEPFVLRSGAVDDKWFPEFSAYRAAARRVADASRAAFVPFQAIFDEAAKYAPPEHWARDGVHPSAAGASLMAHAWLRAVGNA